MNDRNRTPIILGIIAGILLVAVVITLSIYLTRGATPADTAAPPASPTAGEAPAAPTPAQTTPSTPEPSEPAADPTGVVLSATGFTLSDDTGAEIFTFGWGDDTAPAVEALTEAFGAAPSERTEEGNGSTYPDYTVYQWSGFALYDMVATDDLPRDEYTQPTYLRYTANTVGDVAITAEFDLEIGAAVADLDPADEWERGDGTRIVFEPDRSGFAGGVPTYAALADTGGETVTAILYYYYAG